jgi:hypothetical protein
MTLAKEKAEQTARSFICVGALAVTISFFTPWHAEQITNICATNARGDALPNRQVDGVLRYFEGSYYLERGQADNVVVDYCGGKSGCEIPDRSFRQLTGATAHAEFCGRRLSKLDVSGTVVFKLTQDWLNSQYENLRIGIRWTGEIMIAIGGLLLLWRRSRR